uniref:branched-chain amino acid ABC transporter permease n=1 Tax=Castellaniella sp. TaxID=1955812 RepID=UPI002B00167E
MAHTTQASASRSPVLCRSLFWLLLLGVGLLALAPWWAGRANLRLFSEFFYMLALAQMWNLLAGYGGLLSIGQQAYIGIGGYVLVFFGLKLGIDPFLTIPLAGLVCGLLSLPFGALMFRLKGAYFAVGTWVLAEICRLVLANISDFGGGSGLSVTATLRGIPAWWRESITLWSALALGVGATAFVYFLLRSRHGLALTAVRDNVRAAASLGVSTRRIQWFVYVSCAVGCGMTGALIFITKLRISPDAAFSIDWMVAMIFIVVIGGIGTIEGPLLSTLLYFILREQLSDYGSWYLIFVGMLTV